MDISDHSENRSNQKEKKKIATEKQHNISAI